MAIKAIETEYNGYLFRSRLEARWAVFFDALGIPYEYEKEGFDLDGIWYLPDFYLPVQDYWIEIKPACQGQPEHPMFDYFFNPPYHAEEPHPGLLPFFLIAGDPWIDFETHIWSVSAYECYIIKGEYLDDRFTIFSDMGYLWCECPDCGYIGLCFGGRSARLPCKECYYCAFAKNGRRRDPGFEDCVEGECPIHGTNWSVGCPRHGGNFDKDYNADSPRLLSAYKAARQARFSRRYKRKR